MIEVDMMSAVTPSALAHFGRHAAKWTRQSSKPFSPADMRRHTELYQ